MSESYASFYKRRMEKFPDPKQLKRLMVAVGRIVCELEKYDALSRKHRIEEETAHAILVCCLEIHLPDRQYKMLEQSFLDLHIGNKVLEQPELNAWFQNALAKELN
jgi:hypothetical protein